MCCDDEVRPHDLENCLKHCNLDSNFELNVTKNCRTYENGGTLHILSCTCDVHHQGDCCQGKMRIFFVFVNAVKDQVNLSVFKSNFDSVLLY